jgi:hypothetical protein
MASALIYKVRDRDKRLVASCRSPDDALLIARKHGFGAKIVSANLGHLYTETPAMFPHSVAHEALAQAIKTKREAKLRELDQIQAAGRAIVEERNRKLAEAAGE